MPVRERGFWWIVVRRAVRNGTVHKLDFYAVDRFAVLSGMYVDWLLQGGGEAVRVMLANRLNRLAVQHLYWGPCNVGIF